MVDSHTTQLKACSAHHAQHSTAPPDHQSYKLDRCRQMPRPQGAHIKHSPVDDAATTQQNTFTSHSQSNSKSIRNHIHHMPTD